MKMKDRQSNDSNNADRSGGVNLQGEAPSAMIHKPAPVTPASTIPAKGTSNGGK